MNRLATTFTGLKFVNPFILASAPPTESKRKILKAFEAGWGGVVTKTIGLHPVENVAGPKTIYQRSSEIKPYVSRMKRSDTVSHSSWNWELISDQALEIWLPDLEEIKKSYPDRMVIASIMAGAGNEEEMKNWQKLARACIGVGWGLAGLCPGPAIASLSFGGSQSALFVLAMLLGMRLKPQIRSQISSSSAT